LRVIGVASDGLEAVQKAEELQPDLILLDIGLPSLNGIEVARQIRKFSPKSKILFVSQESSADIVQGALGTGAQGYVLKSDARRELLEGVNAVLRGEQFVSGRFAGHDFTRASDAGASPSVRSNAVVEPLQQDIKITHHEVGFYSDDRRFLDDLTQFIGAALKAGNAAIVVATESHGTVFFHDCGHMAWKSVLRLSRADISRWMPLTRSRRSCSMACLIRFDL
jgi:CheY-like chemotaxis protein